jgi:hypothetical protein
LNQHADLSCDLYPQYSHLCLVGLDSLVKGFELLVETVFEFDFSLEFDDFESVLRSALLLGLPSAFKAFGLSLFLFLLLLLIALASS